MNDKLEIPHSSTIPLFDALYSERLILRAYKTQDADVLFRAVDESRADLLKWIRFPNRHKTLEQTRNWIMHQEANWSSREDMPAGIWLKTNGQYLGDCRLYPQDWESRYFSLSYWLRSSALGQGYMTEATQLWINFALQSLSATRIEISCDVLNEASAAVARRLGFRQEGQLRNHRLGVDGTLRDTLILGLIPEDIVERKTP